MARRADTTPDSVSAARLKWLYSQLRGVQKDRRAAAKAGSHSAVAALRREERSLRDLIDQERLAQAKAAAESEDRPLTEEERADLLAALVDRATDAELDVFFKEWLHRHRYRAYVDEGGTAHIVPLGEDVSGLRLVT